MKKSNKYWDRPWSLVEGCTPCSPGCENCWNAAMARRFRRPPFEPNLTNGAGRYNGRVVFRADRLGKPARAIKPAVWALWTDLFHEAIDDQEAIVAAFDVMAWSPEQTFLVLTKRARRMCEMLDGLALVFPNVWLGVTVCTQAEADEKIPWLLKTPAAHRYVSVEPCLSEINLSPWLANLNWIICGPETGPGKRPFDFRWATDLHSQCREADVPFFFKGAGLVRDLPW